jgi:hypothetical protein
MRAKFRGYPAQVPHYAGLTDRKATGAGLQPDPGRILSLTPDSSGVGGNISTDGLLLTS